MPISLKPLGRRLRSVVLCLALSAGSLILVPAAPAAGAPKPAGATAVTSLPYRNAAAGTWDQQPAATGAANAAVAAACNAGQPLYRVRWFRYRPAQTTTVVAQGTMDYQIGRDHVFLASGVAVLNAHRRILACDVVSDSINGLASSGPVTLRGGRTAYFVQFVRENPDADGCSVVCYDTTEDFSLQRAPRSAPVNDEYTSASLITSFPATLKADTTLATRGPLDNLPYSCGTAGTTLTRTVWWTFTPLTDGVVVPSASDDYVAIVGERTASGVDFFPTDCGNPDPVAVTAGTSYVIIAGYPQDYRWDEVGVGRKVTVSIPSGPQLARPDLVVTSVSMSPAAPKPGDRVRFSATISNRGRIATPSGVVHGVSFTVDGVRRTWSHAFTGGLVPGASVTVTATDGPWGKATWKATRGEHRLVARVDDRNRIPGESDERNNTRELRFTVIARPS